MLGETLVAFGGLVGAFGVGLEGVAGVVAVGGGIMGVAIDTLGSSRCQG